MRLPLERPLSATVWELRAAWATGRTVGLRFDGRASYPRAQGRVLHVAASGVYVLLAERGRGRGTIQIPTAIILAIRDPHFSEPLDDVDGRPDLPEQMAGQMSIFEEVT